RFFIVYQKYIKKKICNRRTNIIKRTENDNMNMDRTDAEMMEMETTAIGQPELPSDAGQGDVLRDFLALARQLLNQGKPSQALQAHLKSLKCYSLLKKNLFLLVGLLRKLNLWSKTPLRCMALSEGSPESLGLSFAYSSNLAWGFGLVVMAMRTRGGDEAVFESLHRARELYRSRLQESSAVDQLASLFAECAIAEVHPSKTEPAAGDEGGPSVGLGPDAQGTSILAESGRMQIVLDAFSDGSSFICLQCGGLAAKV
ncbi:hypothetical protein Prudu_003693, partial [Prunus dulcis]